MSRRRRAWDFDPNKVQSARIAEIDKDDVAKEIANLLKYRDHTIKFNSELGSLWRPDRIYASLVPEPVTEALAVLSQFPEWASSINSDGDPYLYMLKVPIDEARKAMNEGRRRDNFVVESDFRIKLDGMWPCPRINWSDALLMPMDHPQYALLADYAGQISRVDAQNNETDATVRMVLNACNTWGQVRRLWPELFTFLPASTGKVRVVNQQKQKSRLPQDICEEEMGELCRARDKANQILTQAVLLKTMGPPPARQLLLT